MGDQSSKIPVALISQLVDALSSYHTRTELVNIFTCVRRDIVPSGYSKADLVRDFFTKLRDDEGREQFIALGEIVQSIMENPPPSRLPENEATRAKQDIVEALHTHGLQYENGGRVAKRALKLDLEKISRTRDLAALQTELVRAESNLERDPPAALTAACSLLESCFKVYIENNGLSMPSKKAVRDLWKVVQKDLNWTPKGKEDKAVQQVLESLNKLVEGIGDLRREKSSAHGRLPEQLRKYRVEPRHGRLAVHAAYTVVVFVLETWETKNKHEEQ